VYWAEEEMTQNGSSNLGGSMVAGGNIRINGQLDFRQSDIFSPNIAIEDWDCDSDVILSVPPPADPLRVDGWSARFD
jgi:hypothetical protein